MPAHSSKKRTATTNFGAGKRESHDASAFYDRFEVPTISDSEIVKSPAALDEIYCADARMMTDEQVADSSVALVVTSPPYFAGKEYEEALGEGHIPGSYIEYLQMLRDVFAVCVQKLEDGGRIAVNVANLGRRPYRSLSSDIIRILEYDLKLLLRGEIIWQKSSGASGSCAWGSFQSSVNPVFRDLTERVIIASKGRFDRSISRPRREGLGLPSTVTLRKDDFMEWTTDVWELPPESATRVNHPAPFPVELPERLIDLYTFEDDLVLDPFMGSGSTAVAAIQTDRHFVGFDTDPNYVQTALQRVETERSHLSGGASTTRRPRLPMQPATSPENEDFPSKAAREGQAAKQIAEQFLQQNGFQSLRRKVKLPVGVEVDFSAHDAKGNLYYFIVAGAFTSRRSGLKSSETLWKVLGKAAAVSSHETGARVVLLTPDKPSGSSSGARAISAVTGASQPVFDVLDMFSGDDAKRLRLYATDGNRKAR